jgi:hypothetical protein
MKSLSVLVAVGLTIVVATLDMSAAAVLTEHTALRLETWNDWLQHRGGANSRNNTSIDSLAADISMVLSYDCSICTVFIASVRISSVRRAL